MKYLLDFYNPDGSHVALAPFESSNWPIAWRWITDAWHYVADDFTPRDLSVFLRLKEEQNAIHLGVYENGDLGGLLMLEPKTPYLCFAHAVFRSARERTHWNRDTLVVSLELGKLFAWSLGYAKVAAETFEDNALMIRLVEAVGGIREGRFERETFRDGKASTLLRYGIFRDEL